MRTYPRNQNFPPEKPRPESRDAQAGTERDRRAFPGRAPWAGRVLFLIGAMLLAISLVGDFTTASHYASLPPRSWERFDPVLASRTPDIESLFQAAQARAGRNLREQPPHEAMSVLYGIVIDRFTHGDRATYSPFSNWLLWSLGFADPRFRDIQDPDLLLRNGHSAMCGDVSYVLMRLAEMSRIPTRHVLLDGHIVMEAWYDGNWHAYDPDMEVVIRDETGRVLSVREVEGIPDLVQRAYSVRGDPAFTKTIMGIYGIIASHRYIAYPGRSIVGSRGQRPGRVEQAAGVARFAVPLVVLAAGVFLIRTGKRRKGRNMG